MPTEKHVKFILILNWRSQEVRVVKKRARLGLTDIPITVDLTLVIPEKQELSVKGKVTLSESQISNVVIDAFDRVS